MPLRFARRQAQLMEDEGLSIKEAQLKVEVEMGIDVADRESTRKTQYKDALKTIQSQEENVLRGALIEARKLEEAARLTRRKVTARKPTK